MADESKVQLAQADITPVAMTDVTPEAAGEHQTITRETLKGFMDERLHELIDNLSDDVEWRRRRLRRDWRPIIYPAHC